VWFRDESPRATIPVDNASMGSTKEAIAFELDRLLIYACRVYTAPRRGWPASLRGMRIFLGELHHTIMNPPMIAHANKSLAFSLYDFHLNGVSVEKLAAATRFQSSRSRNESKPSGFA
jgi:hypothetical protein